jgi:CNT family concentrative nucleoside transporter
LDAERDGVERLVSLLGLLVILALAWLFSENRRKMNFRLIASGLVLQFLVAVALLRTTPGQVFFRGAQDFFARLISFSNAGSAFVFGDLVARKPFALSVLPTLIFVSSLMSVLFYLGLMQWIVKAMARLMVWVMDTSGSESLAAAAEVFVGMTESPLVVRPYVDTMTRSELMAMMTAGLGSVAGGVLAAYADMGVDAGHLMAASLMSAPASLVIAKIMVPETAASVTKGTVQIEIPRQGANVMDAACSGAADGLKLALNVAAMMIAFIALIHMLNWCLGLSAHLGGPALSLERILGWAFSPLAWVMGVPWHEAQSVGMLLGKKTVFNEFLAYQDLVGLAGQLSPRSTVIATYALCGFANFGSVAIQIGGVGGLVPSRREDIARLGIRAMIGGTLATFMMATIAGILIG